MKPNQEKLAMNMKKSPEEMLTSIIEYKAADDRNLFRQWFLKQFGTDTEKTCSLEEFAVYFLNNLRQYVEIHLKTSGTETPKCQTPVRALKSNREDVFMQSRLLEDSLRVESPKTVDKSNTSIQGRHSRNISLEFETNETPRSSFSTECSNFSHNTTSTPIRRVTPKNIRKSTTTSASTNKSASSSICLGDFLVLTPNNNRSQKKKTTHTSSQQLSQKSQNEKPKKRVQPITINKKVEKSNNKSSVFAGESSFSNENNILKISNYEVEDKGQCAILAARKSLAMNTLEITEEIKDVSLPLTSTTADLVTTSTPVKELYNVDISLDMTSLQNNTTLRRLAQIYTLIIDLNLVTNILNELSLLLNLFNASKTKANNEELPPNQECQNNNFSMLEDTSNAVYFALLCLELERHSLASLDAKSLGVVLITERFGLLNNDVKNHLKEVYQRKQVLASEKPFCDTFLYNDSKVYNNVYFQHEHDSRENFTSQLEFTNFRAQRDLFYKCLKIWESNHLNPTWRFSSEVTPIIREIFNISENCINMAHLAKLFVSQLLISASNTSSPEDIGLEVDFLKFSKLTQRLIAPSQFSVDYQFPRTEAFFRDFILNARSLAFAEQLKMELYSQLTIQNNSSLDLINISRTENEEEDVNMAVTQDASSFIVSPDILNSLLILAKFLGFTFTLPYNISSCNLIPAKIEKNQVRLRSLMQSTLDIRSLLEQAIEQNKLLVVIPWMVQYFAMLDNITLQLENHMKTLNLMFALYYYLGSEDSKPFCAASEFIMNLCLGWLFETKQFITEQYYNYRATIKGSETQISACDLEFIRSKVRYQNTKGNDLNPYLESLLPIACPFLAEFRVSIMPAKYAQTKNASRTGRYRHITTRIAEMSSTGPTKIVPQKKLQKSLIQAFLQSQNASTRQIIKFCIERCYKSTVKDGQLKILLPAKTNADNLVNQITSFQYHFVYNSIQTIYSEAHAQVKHEWKVKIPQILHERINNALESLLPEETSPVLKKTYLKIIEKEVIQKISQWFHANIFVDNYFCTSLQEIANKICVANKNKVQLGSNHLCLKKESPSVSDLIDELQYWLHCTSVRLDRFENSIKIVELCQNLIKAFENELPSSLYHLLGAGVVQLLQHIITRSSCHLTDDLVENACQVFLHPSMLEALNSISDKNICIYQGLLSNSFVESLGENTESFQQLAKLIIILIKKRILKLSYINDLFVSLFKHEWHSLVFAEISNMLKSIAKATADLPKECNGNGKEEDEDDDIDKSNLFMEMLADLSRDVDF